MKRLHSKTNRKWGIMKMYHTNGVGGGNEGPACQLFQLHSLRLEDLACWQTPGEQHPATRPDHGKNTEKVLK